MSKNEINHDRHPHYATSTISGRDSGEQHQFPNTTTKNASTKQYLRLGRYGSKGLDRHPNIPVSQVLMFPKNRQGRLQQRKTTDPESHKSFGDAIIYKEPNCTRFLFQNVKGMTYSTGCEDYRYFLSGRTSFSVDLYGGMAETSTGWQHTHLQADLKSCICRQF